MTATPTPIPTVSHDADIQCISDPALKEHAQNVLVETRRVDGPNRNFITRSKTQHDTEKIVIAEIYWSVLPAALQKSLGPDFQPYIDKHDAFYGMTIRAGENRSPEHETVYRLTAWVLASDGKGHPTHQTLYEICGNSKRNGCRKPAHIEVRRSYDLIDGLTVFSIDAVRDHPILKLTTVSSTDRGLFNWVWSDLPTSLGLGGGQYELRSVHQGM